MSELLAFAKKMQNFNAVDALKEVLNSNESKELLIKLNTQSQLFEQGINSEGIKLDTIGGKYSIRTVLGVEGQFEGKIQKGLPTDRITLFSEGDLYNSFRIEIKYPYIVIIYDDMKEGVRLSDRWGEDIGGLTEESKEIYEEFATRKTLDIVLSNFL